jgi:hypothetical protein
MSDTEYGPILSTLVEFLNEIQFKYLPPQLMESAAGEQTFRVDSNISLTNGLYKVVILGDEDRKLLSFYAISNMIVPLSRRSEVSEFINRANYGMTVGNLEFDFSEGEIHFKTAIPCDGTPLTYALLRNLLYSCGDLMDLYSPAIESVIIGDATAREADELMRKQETEH